MSTSSVNPSDVIQKMVNAVCSLIDHSAEIIRKNVGLPVLDSRAIEEYNGFADPKLIEDTYVRAYLCFENAADHLMAFTDTLKQPAKTLSPYTCVRSVLEASAIALWLLDLNIDARERVGRCFGYRFKEFEEQLKFFNLGQDKQVVAGIKKRMGEVEAKAISLGYPKLTSNNGKINGIATHMPETVGLIKMTLNKEAEYRLLSGVAHSYLWATRQVGFQLIEETSASGQKFIAIEKYAHPKMILSGIYIAVPTFAKVLWVLGKYYGWNMNEIEDLLTQTFEKISFDKSQYFWL